MHHLKQLIVLMTLMSWFAMSGALDVKLWPPKHKLQVFALQQCKLVVNMVCHLLCVTYRPCWKKSTLFTATQYTYT